MHTHPLFWLPNALTVFRCVLAIFVAWILLQVAQKEASVLAVMNAPEVAFDTRFMHQDVISDYRKFWGHIAFLVFAVSAITDFLDGYLARKWNVTSRFGRLLDPIADKIFVGLPLLVLAAASDWPLPLTLPVLVIVFRDISITLLRFAGLSAGTMSVSFLAKLKTFTEMIVIAALLLVMALTETSNPLFTLSLKVWTVCLWVTAAFSLYTGIQYIIGVFLASSQSRKTEGADCNSELQPTPELGHTESHAEQDTAPPR